MATGYISRKGDFVLYGVESTYGTAVSPTRALGIIEPDGFTAPTESRGMDTKHGIGSADPQYYTEDVHKMTGGSIKVAVQRPEFLEYIIGAASDSGGPGYDHTLDPDDDCGSLTIARLRTDTSGTAVKTDKYVGCILKSVRFEAKKGDVLKATIGFDCQKVVCDSTAVATTSQSGETPILFKGSTFEVASTGVATITDWSWTFEREVAFTNCLNSLLPKFASGDNWKCSSEMTYAYVQTTEAAYYRGSADGTQDAVGTDRQIDFTITNGETGADERTIQFLGTSSKFSDFKYAGFGDHALSTLTAKFKTIQVVATDSTANWDA